MNRFMKHIGLAAMLVCVNPANAQMGSDTAEILVNWNLDGLSQGDMPAVKASPTKVNDAVESSNLTVGGTLGITTWLDSLAVYSRSLMGDLEGAVAMDHYYSFTLAPKKGEKISYSGIFNRFSVNAGNMETGASIKFVLMSSATGFAPASEGAPLKPLASFIVSHPPNNDKATTKTGTFDLSGIEALQHVGVPVEFRIYTVLVDGVGDRMGYGHIFYKDGQDDLRVMGTVE